MKSLIAAFAVLLLGGSFISRDVGLYNPENEIVELESTYQKREGHAHPWGHYHIRSFDGGSNWYAIELAGKYKKDITSVGDAHTVYPGLLNFLQDRDKARGL